MKMNKRMGMELFNPPNVRGWTGYTSWINSNTLLERKALVRRFFKGNLIKKKKKKLKSKKFINRFVNVYLPLPPLTKINKSVFKVIKSYLFYRANL